MWGSLPWYGFTPSPSLDLGIVLQAINPLMQQAYFCCPLAKLLCASCLVSVSLAPSPDGRVGLKD